jgi:hypothetical protein
MNTEIALLEHASNRVCKSYIIGTSGSAIVATDTTVGINHHNAVLAFISSSYWTYGIADRALTMIAQPREKKD